MRLSFPGLCAIALLAGCSGGGSGIQNPDPVFIPQNFFGTTSAAASRNGLVFADGTQTYEDVAGQTLSVKVARHLTDYSTGETRLVISDETVTFDPRDFGGARYMTITIGDETLAFEAELATDSNGRTWRVYRPFNGTYSTVADFWSYSAGGRESEPGALDTEAVFVYGFETSPDVVAALSSNVTYTGDWFGRGAIIDETGALLSSRERGDGTITLYADFAADTLGGNVTGSFTDFGDVDGVIAQTGILGNGFVGDLSLTACGSGETCSSASQVSGVFFGPNAEELSGFIGFDVTRIDGDGLLRRLISGAGFVAE
jgi:hypothetical protein